jgi:hypothetical protein
MQSCLMTYFFPLTVVRETLKQYFTDSSYYSTGGTKPGARGEGEGGLRALLTGPQAACVVCTHLILFSSSLE